MIYGCKWRNRHPTVFLLLLSFFLRLNLYLLNSFPIPHNNNNSSSRSTSRKIYSKFSFVKKRNCARLLYFFTAQKNTRQFNSFVGLHQFITSYFCHEKVKWKEENIKFCGTLFGFLSSLKRILLSDLRYFQGCWWLNK